MAVLAFGLAAAAAVPATAAAATTGTSGTYPPGSAMYQGRIIDLAQGWQGAQACYVPASGLAQCFATKAEMQSYIAQSGTASTTSPNATTGLQPATLCGAGQVELFQNANFGGAELSLDNVGVWANLADYGFANITSSWINDTSCVAYLNSGTDGSGTYYTMSAFNQSGYVGSAFNDLAQSEVID